MVAACRRQLGLGLAAWLRAASTAGRIFQCGSLRYAATPQWLGTTGVPRGGRWTVVVGLYGFATWLDVCRAVDARRHHHLGIYLHQITLLGPGPVTWRDSSLHRLACLAVRAHVTSSATGVHASLVADGACGPVLGRVAGMAIRACPSGSAVLCVRVRAPPWGPVRIGWDPMVEFGGGRISLYVFGSRIV